jgi:hypothetical protein
MEGSMANWLVAAHGNIEHKRAKQTGKAGLKDTVTVPTGMEVVMFCPNNRQLSMSGGWKMWDMLMYGEHGGESKAYKARYNRKLAGSEITNYYAYIDASDFNQWVDGANRGNSHSAINSYGIWEVGDPSAKKIDLDLQPDKTIQLGEILGQAKAAGVARVYWGCCRAHVRHFGTANVRNTSSSDQAPYTPTGLM